ncbi:MAG: HAD family hydrolase [Bacteroidales bacterium]|nr:HAD family hydrolase [Bacteroidales bacterium]
MFFKEIIFDLDGTLLNTIEDLGTATNYALEQCGFPTHPLGAYKQKVGHGIRNLVINALPPEQSDQTVDKVLGVFVEYYVSHIDVHTRPYDGIAELLRDLQTAGTKVAIASNKFQEGTEKLVAEFFPDIKFCAIFGNRPGAPLKPSPEIVEEAMRLGGIGKDAPGEAGRDENAEGLVAMVGDSSTDIKTAKNAGITSIAVSWGFRSRENLVADEPDYLTDTMEELRKILLP